MLNDQPLDFLSSARWGGVEAIATSLAVPLALWGGFLARRAWRLEMKRDAERDRLDRLAQASMVFTTVEEYRHTLTFPDGLRQPVCSFTVRIVNRSLLPISQVVVALDVTFWPEESTDLYRLDRCHPGQRIRQQGGPKSPWIGMDDPREHVGTVLPADHEVVPSDCQLTWKHFCIREEPEPPGDWKAVVTLEFVDARNIWWRLTPDGRLLDKTEAAKEISVIRE